MEENLRNFEENPQEGRLGIKTACQVKDISFTLTLH